MSTHVIELMPIKISAIVSDYDGTLCPNSSMASGNNTVPPDLLSVLFEISEKIPVSIVSSKDLNFLREKTQFARVVSAIMGIEITQFWRPNEDRPDSKNSTNLITEYQLSEVRKITQNSKFLDEIENKVRNEFQGIKIGHKLTYLDHILAGITIDYRHIKKWEHYKTNIEPELKKKIQQIIKSSNSNSLFLQTYSDHPFIDVYAVRCDKAKALDFIRSLLNNPERKILYLGDSENDNPAFSKADLSIGVRSDRRINTKLNSDYVLEFNELRPFLQKLETEDFIFDRMTHNLN
jgi:HAD superfamily hydrolase (TIGR01484 family)